MSRTETKADRLARLKRERVVVETLIQEANRKIKGAKYRRDAYGDKLVVARTRAKYRHLEIEHQYLTQQIQELEQAEVVSC